MPTLTLYGVGLPSPAMYIQYEDYSSNYPNQWQESYPSSQIVDSDGNYIYDKDGYKAKIESFPLHALYVPFDSLNSTTQSEGINLGADDEQWLYLIDEFGDMKDYLSIGTWVGKYTASNENTVLQSQNFIEQYVKNLFDSTFLVDEQLLYLQGILNSKVMPNGFSNFYDRSDMEIASMFSMMRTELWQQASSLLAMIMAGYCNNDSIVGIDEYNKRHTFNVGKLCWKYDTTSNAINFVPYATTRQNLNTYYYGDMITTSAQESAFVWSDIAIITQGQICFPTTYNGDYFMCVVAGNTGTSEPLWDSITYPYTDNTVQWVRMPTLKYYKCIVSGTTAAAEPSFHAKYTIGNTITDGTVTWECVEPITQEHNLIWRTFERYGEKNNRVYDFSSITIREGGWYYLYLDYEDAKMEVIHTASSTLKTCFDAYVQQNRKHKTLPIAFINFIFDGANYRIKECINLQQQGRLSSRPEVWKSGYSYKKGNIVYARTFNDTPYYFEAQNDGTSDAAEPVWDTTIGNTTSETNIDWVNIGLVYGLNHNCLLSYATKSRGGLIKCDVNSERNDNIFEQIFKKVYALDINLLRQFAPLTTNTDWVASKVYYAYNYLYETRSGIHYRCTRQGFSGKSKPPFVFASKEWAGVTSYGYGDVIWLDDPAADNVYWVCMYPGTTTSSDDGFKAYTTAEECYIDSDGIMWKCLGTDPRTIFDNVNFWTASTKYRIGEVITPKTIAAGSGSFFVCTKAGTSGTGEPAFLTGVNYQDDGSCNWDHVSDSVSGVDNSVYAKWTFVNYGALEYKRYENN